MLSAILIGNNVVNLYASSLATVLATHIWGNKIGRDCDGRSDAFDPDIRRDHAEDGGDDTG